MKTRNNCYTYFKIVGDFCPNKISEMLGLQPEMAWKKGDVRNNGTKYDFSLWEIGRCDDYNVEVDKQMRKTISAMLRELK